MSDIEPFAERMAGRLHGTMFTRKSSAATSLEVKNIQRWTVQVWKDMLAELAEPLSGGALRSLLEQWRVAVWGGRAPAHLPLSTARYRENRGRRKDEESWTRLHIQYLRDLQLNTEYATTQHVQLPFFVYMEDLGAKLSATIQQTEGWIRLSNDRKHEIEDLVSDVCRLGLSRESLGTPPPTADQQAEMFALLALLFGHEASLVPHETSLVPVEILKDSPQLLMRLVSTRYGKARRYATAFSDRIEQLDVVFTADTPKGRVPLPNLREERAVLPSEGTAEAAALDAALQAAVKSDDALNVRTSALLQRVSNLLSGGTNVMASLCEFLEWAAAQCRRDAIPEDHNDAVDESIVSSLIRAVIERAEAPWSNTLHETPLLYLLDVLHLGTSAGNIPPGTYDALPGRAYPTRVLLRAALGHAEESAAAAYAKATRKDAAGRTRPDDHLRAVLSELAFLSVAIETLPGITNTWWQTIYDHENRSPWSAAMILGFRRAYRENTDAGRTRAVERFLRSTKSLGIPREDAEAEVDAVFRTMLQALESPAAVYQQQELDGILDEAVTVEHLLQARRDLWATLPAEWRPAKEHALVAYRVRAVVTYAVAARLLVPAMIAMSNGAWKAPPIHVDAVDTASARCPPPGAAPPPGDAKRQPSTLPPSESHEDSDTGEPPQLEAPDLHPHLQFSASTRPSSLKGKVAFMTEEDLLGKAGRPGGQPRPKRFVFDEGPPPLQPQPQPQLAPFVFGGGLPQPQQQPLPQPQLAPFVFGGGLPQPQPQPQQQQQPQQPQQQPQPSVLGGGPPQRQSQPQRQPPVKIEAAPSASASTTSRLPRTSSAGPAQPPASSALVPSRHTGLVVAGGTPPHQTTAMDAMYQAIIRASQRMHMENEAAIRSAERLIVFGGVGAPASAPASVSAPAMADTSCHQRSPQMLPSFRDLLAAPHRYCPPDLVKEEQRQVLGRTRSQTRTLAERARRDGRCRGS